MQKKQKLAKEHSEQYVNCGASTVEAAEYDFLAGWAACEHHKKTPVSKFERDEYKRLAKEWQKMYDDLKAKYEPTILVTSND
jgi:hypothetical protein